jgi:hypothetical protein
MDFIACTLLKEVLCHESLSHGKEVVISKGEGRMRESVPSF